MTETDEKALCASVTDAHAVDPLSEHTDDEEVDEEPDITHTTSEGEDDYPHAGHIVIKNGPAKSKAAMASLEAALHAGLGLAAVTAFMTDVFGGYVDEVGYRTSGHRCIDTRDRREALQKGSSLLYGEVLTTGVVSMMDRQHLCAAHSRTLYDLGMGTGKLALQTWLQFPNLERVVGIELAHSRYLIAERSLIGIAHNFPTIFALVSFKHGEYICLRFRSGKPRYIEFRRCDLFDITPEEQQDMEVVVLQTDIPESLFCQLCRFLNRFCQGTRFLTYLDMCTVWEAMPTAPFPLCRFAPNSRFDTSWSSKDLGHRFFLWRKLHPRGCWVEELGLFESKQVESGVHSSRRKGKGVSKLRAFFSRGFRRADKLARCYPASE